MNNWEEMMDVADIPSPHELMTQLATEYEARAGNGNGVNGNGGASGAELTPAQAMDVEILGKHPVYPAITPVPPAPIATIAPVTTTMPSRVGTTVVSGAQPTHGDVTLGQLGTIVNGVPISGPGVPEPPAQMVSKHWHLKCESEKYGAFFMFYWKLIDGRMMSYHSPTKTWKIWRPKKHVVISRDPRVSNLRKLERVHKRVQRMLKAYQPKQKKGFPAEALAGKFLSKAEQKLLK